MSIDRPELNVHALHDGGPDKRISVRERVASSSSSEVATLLVHGSTLSSVLFDVPIDGLSWLDRIALGGRRAFALDMRGFGASYRPPEMDMQIAEGPRPVSTREGAEDLETCLDYILGLEGIRSVDVLGFSWGTMVLGDYLARKRKDARIRKAIFYAPLYADVNAAWLAILADPNDRSLFTEALSGSRKTTLPALRERWNIDINDDDPTNVRPEEVLMAIWEDSIANDPGQKLEGEVAFRVPNGPFQDMHSVYRGQPVFDAAAITTPSLILRTSLDTTSTRRDALGLYDALASTEKQYLEIAGAGHIACAERDARRVFDAVSRFCGD